MVFKWQLNLSENVPLVNPTAPLTGDSSHSFMRWLFLSPFFHMKIFRLIRQCDLGRVHCKAEVLYQLFLSLNKLKVAPCATQDVLKQAATHDPEDKSEGLSCFPKTDHQAHGSRMDDQKFLHLRNHALLFSICIAHMLLIFSLMKLLIIALLWLSCYRGS